MCKKTDHRFIRGYLRLEPAQVQVDTGKAALCIGPCEILHQNIYHTYLEINEAGHSSIERHWRQLPGLSMETQVKINESIQKIMDTRFFKTSYDGEGLGELCIEVDEITCTDKRSVGCGQTTIPYHSSAAVGIDHTIIEVTELFEWNKDKPAVAVLVYGIGFDKLRFLQVGLEPNLATDILKIKKLDYSIKENESWNPPKHFSGLQ
ncbi:hypothetical protein SUGI_0001950 [Cryptomeria japonica]|nr:hypothetical protein SUGI_0001950 [Cryptomeria japonica]